MEFSLTESISQLRTIFSSEKIVRNRAMNLMGCQLARVLIARALLYKRRWQWKSEITDIERTLLRNGIVLIENFFDNNTFEELLSEIDRADAALISAFSPSDKFGIVRQQISLHKKPDLFPLANRLLLNNKLLLHAVRLQEGWKESDNFFNTGTVLKYERLEQIEEAAIVAENRDMEISSGDLHADTFHFVTKAFFTLNDMTTANSPYTYCYSSHVLNVRRLIWEYQNSIKSSQYQADYYNRVYPDQISAMNLKITPIVARKNTLIITDTFGFHFRGQMKEKGNIRRMLRMDFRSNPFRL